MTGSRSSDSALCTACGRRRAIYLRRSSGERLCHVCLERSLLKNIKRSFHYVKPPTRAVILYVIPPCRLVEGVSGLALLSRLELKYGGVIVAALPNIITGKLGRDLLRGAGVIYYDSKCLERLRKELGLVTPMSFIYYLSDHLMSTIEPLPNAIATPITLTDIVEEFLTNLLTGKSFRFKNSVKGIPLVHIFKRVLRTDILAFSLAKGIATFMNHELRCDIFREVEELAAEISLRHSELAYRLPLSIANIMSYLR